MPLPSQGRLLRVLQEQPFARLGGHSSIRTNARVLAATTQDLEQLVRIGHFRAELYYRLIE